MKLDEPKPNENRAYLGWLESAGDFEHDGNPDGFILLDLLHPDEVALVQAGELDFGRLVQRDVENCLKALPLVLPRNQIDPAWKESLLLATQNPEKRLSVRLRQGASKREVDFGRAVLALTGWEQDEQQPDPVFIEEISLASEQLARQVDAALSSSNFIKSVESKDLPAGSTYFTFLSDILEHRVRELRRIFVGVYDVGQGSASALVDSNEHPRVFFDIGKPIYVYNYTKPALKPKFFNCDQAKIKRDMRWLHAPVVLSHWDFDHWAGVLQSAYVYVDNDGVKHAKLTLVPDALDRYWIAPNQEHLNLSPTHRELIRLLKKKENGSTKIRALQYWPDDLSELPFTHGLIVKAMPDPKADKTTASLRNNSGLAMLVTFRPDLKFAPAHWLLLPGDARSEAIPGLNERELVGMVVAHHGGKLEAVPQASGWAWAGIGGLNPNVVCSVGRPHPTTGEKPYGHPHNDLQEEFFESKWHVDTFTYDAANTPRCGKALGNYVLSLDGTHPLCTCDCVCEGNLSLNPVKSR